MNDLPLYGGITLGLILFGAICALVELSIREWKRRKKEMLQVACCAAWQGEPDDYGVRLDAGSAQRLAPCEPNNDLGFEKLYAKYIVPIWLECGDNDEEE